MKSEASSYTGVYLYSLSEKETCPLSHEVRASIVRNKSPRFASNSTDLGVKTSSRSNPIVVWFLLNKFTALNMTDRIQAERDDRDRECSYHIKRSPLISQRSTLPLVRPSVDESKSSSSFSIDMASSFPPLPRRNQHICCHVMVLSSSCISSDCFEEAREGVLTPGTFLCYVCTCASRALC